MPVKAIPDGYHTLTPTLVCKNAGAAMDFYKKAFGAEEIMRMPGPDGKSVMHGEMQIGSSRFMLSDEWPGCGTSSPQSANTTTATFYLYVENCDAAMDRAVKAGATIAMPLMDMFWGDRMGQVTDPFGHKWGIATHKVDLTPEQIGKAAQEWMKNCAGKQG